MLLDQLMLLEENKIDDLEGLHILKLVCFFSILSLSLMKDTASLHKPLICFILRRS